VDVLPSPLPFLLTKQGHALTLPIKMPKKGEAEQEVEGGEDTYTYTYTHTYTHVDE
jgi:hypothetical protein